MIDNVDGFSFISSSLLGGDDIVQQSNTTLAKPTKLCAFLNHLSCTGPNFRLLTVPILRPSVLHGVRLSGVYYNYHTTTIPTFFLVE